jgi:hypothetical protein
MGFFRNLRKQRETTKAFIRERALRHLEPDLEIQTILPQALRDAKYDLWDDSKLWDAASAKRDYETLYCVQSSEGNTINLMGRPFPGTEPWALCAQFPAHYFRHIALLNHMHAWCRDLLVLGNWNQLHLVASPQAQGRDVKDSAMRFMRYLSNVRETSIEEAKKCLAEGRKMSTARLPTLDVYLLALFKGLHPTESDILAFIKEPSGLEHFRKNPVVLGEY